MRVNTISRIEEFMADALLSSTAVPLGVNVVRLAATQDEEGITSMARSIVIRYVSSSTSVEKRVPLTIERVMTFQIIISAQSYLADSGHDYALQMCAGTYLTLNNTVPVNRGVSVSVPFTMKSESFDGLTDSSHYVYIQNWDIVISELNPFVALDPCVQRGNCRQLFPTNIAEEIKPGEVIYNNKLYSPVLPPPGLNQDYEKEYCGVELRGDDLVYTTDPGQTFLPDWTDYKLVSTGTFDTSGDFLICNVKTRDTDEFVESYFAANCDDRTVLGISLKARTDESNPTRLKTKAEYGWVNVWPQTTIYLDPTDEDGGTQMMNYGWVISVEVGSTLRTEDGFEFYKMNHSTVGTGWIKTDQITVFDPSRTEINIGCDDLHAENDGPQACD